MKSNLQRDLDEICGPSAGEPIPATITTAGLADLFNVGIRHINALAQKGILTRLASGDFDTRDGIRAMVAMHKRGAASADLNAEKIRLAAAQAEKVELQNAEARGELVLAVDVENEWQTVLTDLRATLLSIPRRLTGLDRDTTTRIDGEIRAALLELAEK